MTNIREFKKKEPKPDEPTCLTCPECDGQELVLWDMGDKRCVTCAECDSFLDIEDYVCLQPVSES